jgi:hypothetical protein
LTGKCLEIWKEESVLGLAHSYLKFWILFLTCVDVNVADVIGQVVEVRAILEVLKKFRMIQICTLRIEDFR